MTSRLGVSLLLSLALLLLNGCALEKRNSAAAVSSAGTGKSGHIPKPEGSPEAVLKERLSSRAREVGRLRLQLLAKQAEINQLLIAHERALQEAVSANARLRGLDSKADAVASIAEAALMINNAKESANDEQQQALIHAEKLLETSRKEMQAGNLNAASYLATKASSLAQPTTDRRPTTQTDESQTLFAVPVGMRVRKQSNVRELPGINSKPLFQLAGGVNVKALGYSDLWIRISTESEQEGWIYYDLLEAIDTGAEAE